jgi:DNA-binding response OmpR family regulator
MEYRLTLQTLAIGSLSVCLSILAAAWVLKWLGGKRSDLVMGPLEVSTTRVVMEAGRQTASPGMLPIATQWERLMNPVSSSSSSAASLRAKPDRRLANVWSDAMNATNHRVLIVEDEPNVLLVFRTALESDSYRITAAPDGDLALTWLAQEEFDLVLLDLQMPRVDGMEVLARLRERGDTTPVVMISAHDRAPDVVQAMRLGAIDFLPKPTTPEALRKVVADVLSRAVKLAPPKESASKPAPKVEASAIALTRAKEALNRRAFGEAEAALGQAIAQDAHCAEGHYLIGVLHELRDERHAAYLAYRAALQADPKFEPAKLHLLKYFDDRLM